jgi:hypothetical protein
MTNKRSVIYIEPSVTKGLLDKSEKEKDIKGTNK